MSPTHLLPLLSVWRWKCCSPEEFFTWMCNWTYFFKYSSRQNNLCAIISAICQVRPKTIPIVILHPSEAYIFLYLDDILYPISIGWSSPMKKRFKMTMSVNDENSAGAANNNNCSKVDLDHYETQTDLGRSLWPPCPPPPPPGPQSSAAWIGGPEGPESGGPTYTPLVKVRIW